MELALCIALPIILNNKFKAAGMRGVLPYNLGIIFSVLGFEFSGVIIGFATASPFSIYNADNIILRATGFGALGVLIGAVIAVIIFFRGKKKVDAEVAARFASGLYGQAPYGMPPYGAAPYGQPPYGNAPYGQPPQQQPPYGNAPYGQPPQPPAQPDQQNHTDPPQNP